MIDGLKFKDANLLDEIDGYLNLNGIGIDCIQDMIAEYKPNSLGFNKFPICILSHMYDKKRSKFLVNLISESKVHALMHNYIIFTYEDQKELYKEFENIENVRVEYIPIDNKKYLTLGGKRQYILEYNQQNNNDNAFFIEDDCFDFHLPIGAIGENGNFRNKRYFISNNFIFSFWQYLVECNELTYSGGVDNMSFTFHDSDKDGFIKHYSQTVQAVHINCKSCKDLNINFDDNSGWDDYDMLIQQAIYNKGSTALFFGYTTPPLKSGNSAMSSSLEDLKARCIRNTTKLVNKWGLSLVRIDEKKGLYNSKINWYNIKLGIKNSVNLKDIIGLNNEEAKAYIKNQIVEESDSSKLF